ncbi:MAG TPA: PilZ domain-containing protein [Labilithrix sp.]|nr:PilZ domain-containing protein [Labilithrix sp.]
MSNAHDRRAPGTARMPFDAMVEIGGALGPTFEAQAVNLSEQGMSLRTAYLPEVGQPVMCRFDAGNGMTVVAAGEVLWKEDMGQGGEFGIRFTNLDGASASALQRILGMSEEEKAPGTEPGRKVRLHIDGLASPMRARIKDQLPAGVTAYSELGFLQMGKPLELEDASSGSRRPAWIDRVEVEVNQSSRIPQLVVSLRYDDAEAASHSLAGTEIPIEEGGQTPLDHDAERAPSEGYAEEAEGRDEQAYAPVAVEAKESTDQPSVDEESSPLKGALRRSSAKIQPALASLAKRARVAAALLAARARRGASSGDDVEIPMRRTTAPAPGGGLHTAGRKVVRGSTADERPEETAQPTSGFVVTKKRAVVAGTVGLAAILAFLALRKPAATPELAAAPAADSAAQANAALWEASGNMAPTAATVRSPVVPPLDPLAAAAATAASNSDTVSAPPARPGKPVPFTNGPVGARPTIIKIKMDGPIEGIQGATQPTGFTIVTPNRLAMDSASSLTSKDPRLENVRISNEASGAEFTVSFKDGVPNYIVRARGETLEFVLARASGHDRAEASASTTKKKKSGKKR